METKKKENHILYEYCTILNSSSMCARVHGGGGVMFCGIRFTWLHNNIISRTLVIVIHCQTVERFSFLIIIVIMIYVV